MRKLTLVLIFVIITVTCYAQISYEKGYYVDDSDQKVDCLIKNTDWRNNPTEFKYKLSENSDVVSTSIKAVKEFGIYNVSKYLKSKVKIDRSSEFIDELSNQRAPFLEEEVLFLKVLVEGSTNLYEYIDGNLKRYFYSKNNVTIDQLIYKRYKNSNGKVAKNNRYKQQLWSDLKCPNLKIDKIKKTGYYKNDLISFFVEFNECNNQEYINYDKKQKRDIFNLSIRPGFNYSSLSIENNDSNFRNTEFDNDFGFRFGVEAELIIPFNKNKWSIIVEPTYQQFKTEKKTENGRQNAVVDYKSIELPVGIRHYFFLNEDDKLFINGLFIIDFSGNSAISFDRSGDLEIYSLENFALGLGYKHNNRYSLELRYHTRRELLNGFLFWRSDYSALSIIFGYSLF